MRKELCSYIVAFPFCSVYVMYTSLIHCRPASGAGELDQEPVENLPPVQIMKNLIEQQNTLRKLIDDGKMKLVSLF